MRKDTFLLLVGALIFLTPFLGIPEAWRANILFVLGSAVVLVAISCRLSIRRARRTDAETLHVESVPPGASYEEH